MGYLLDVEWKDGRGLEDLMIWGTEPLSEFLELFDETYGQTEPEEDGYAVFLYYQMKNIILDLNTVIERFMSEIKKGKEPKGDPARLLELLYKVPKEKRFEACDYMLKIIEESIQEKKAE